MSKFSVMTADPAWKFGDKLPGQGRGAERRYRVMTPQEIMRLTLPEMHDNAYLFLWRPPALTVEANMVIGAWGFTPKSEIIWQKLTKKGKPWFGMGRHLRMAHETCVLATRGRAKPLSKNVRSVFSAKVPVDEKGKYVHSGKPDEFFDLVMQLCGGPYIELFARKDRPNWVCVGDQAPRPMAIPSRPE